VASTPKVMPSDGSDAPDRALSPDVRRCVGQYRLVAAADPIREHNAQQLRRAQREYGYSLRQLAIEVENIRKLRGDDDLPTVESLKRTISHILATGQLGEMWRDDLAAVFGVDPDEFFSVPTETRLPPPLLVQLPVDAEVRTVIDLQHQAHIRAEHTFGPQHARPLVEHDLATVEALIPVVPETLKTQVRQAAGTIAEVAGWIAQDLGDHTAAERLTTRAALHLRSSGPKLTAMILMRQSNVFSRSNPDLAVELVADAAELIDGREVGRLAASVARQRALAALANHDERGFHRQAAAALELGNIDPAPGDHAIYADAAYVASDIASGYLRLGHCEEALELLIKYHHAWTPSQHRHRAVAGMRLLHAYIAVGEYPVALEVADVAIPAYLGAPSQRARRHLAQAGTLVRDRRRRNSSGVLQQLAGRIKNATQGVAT
jgi:hypothetical protein